MPVVLRVGGYKFWFYEADLDEPPHVHVGSVGNEVKIWLEPISLARSRGYREHEINEILRLVRKHRGQLMGAWNEERRKRDNR